MIKKTVSGLICLLIMLSSFLCVPVYAQKPDSKDILGIANGIIEWKKKDNGSSEGFLLNDKFLEQAGTTAGDWFPIGLSRLGLKDNYDAYLSVIKDKVENRYKQSGKLSPVKATEWHRISLAVLAAGGDPLAFGTDKDGNKINLISDGTYNRGKTASLGRQGINGWIWGLIAVDSKRYEIPENAYNSRADIIKEIISRQLTDGGFALSGKVSDPDLTAMALQALAPYYNSEKIYTYRQFALKKEVSRNVRQVVDEALEYLSSVQLDSGNFKSWGTENIESTNQVAVALCSLGIDPFTDKRFIKNGNTVFDGIMKFRMKDGGFVHSYKYDPENPEAAPDKSNSMAGEQTLYTMASIWRSINGMRTLYDFRPEQSSSLKARIAEVKSQISKIGGGTAAAELEKTLKAYYTLPENERSYVNNYWKLSDAARAKGIDVEKIAAETKPVEDSGDKEQNGNLTVFSKEDKKAADSLPEKLSTEYYVKVTSLLDKLNRSADFADKNKYKQRLEAAAAEITAVQKEIDSINSEIKNKLYPFENIKIKDKKTVDGIVSRYSALSRYDQSKIAGYEDLIKTKTKIDNTIRGIIITAVLAAAAVVIFIWLVIRINKKRHRKQLEMEEMAAAYEDED